MPRQRAAPSRFPASYAGVMSDPADLPVIPPARARLYGVVAMACALVAPFLLGVGVVLGIVAMGVGSVAHLKGDRLGLPAAVVGGITTIVAMSLVFFTRP